MLLYSYLPYDEVEFKKDYFNGGKYIVPDGYFLDSVSTITAEADYDDEESDHPNIQKRKEAAEAELKGLDDGGRQLFIHPETDFRKIQKMCRYESCELYLNDVDYEDAFYQAFLLQNDDPSNQYLKKVMAKSLYAMSIYKTHRKSPPWERDYKDIEGNSQQIYYVFDKMPAKELNVLALKYVWDVHKSNPKDEQINAMAKQLVASLVKENKLKTKDFYTQKDILAADSVAASGAAQEKDPSVKTGESTGSSAVKTSKYDKIKQTEDAKKTETGYWRYAFASDLDDAEFTNLLKENETRKVVKKSSKKTTTDEDEEEEEYIASYDPEKGYSLGLDKIVVVNPLYLKIDETSKSPVKYEASEAARMDLKEKIMACAGKLDLDVEYLEPNLFSGSDVEKFNDLSILNNWLSEKLDHEDKNVDVIPSNNDDLKIVADKYRINDFAWVGIVSFKEKEQNVAGRIFLSLFFPVLTPFVVADAVTPEYSTYFFTLVADAKTGEIKMEFFNATKIKDMDSIQKSNLYFILEQMKNRTSK